MEENTGSEREGVADSARPFRQQEREQCRAQPEELPSTQRRDTSVTDTEKEGEKESDQLVRLG